MDHSSPEGMGTSSKDKNESISNWDVDNLNNGYYYQIGYVGWLFAGRHNKRLHSGTFYK